MNYLDFDETPKYRKKLGKNKKRKSKSNHKHIYKDVLVRTNINGHEHVYLGKKCSICGELKDVQFFVTELVGHKMHRMLNNKEIFEKYKGWEIVDKKF